MRHWAELKLGILAVERVDRSEWIHVSWPEIEDSMYLGQSNRINNMSGDGSGD